MGLTQPNGILRLIKLFIGLIYLLNMVKGAEQECFAGGKSLNANRFSSYLNPKDYTITRRGVVMWKNRFRINLGWTRDYRFAFWYYTTRSNNYALFCSEDEQVCQYFNDKSELVMSYMENMTLNYRQKSNVFDGVNTNPVVKSKVGWHYVAFRSWTNTWHWGFYNYLNHMRTDLYHGSHPIVLGSKKIRAYLGTHKGGYYSKTTNTILGCVLKNNMPTMMLNGYIHSIVFGCENCTIGTQGTSWYYYIAQEQNTIRPITAIYHTAHECELMRDDELYYDHDIISVLDMNDLKLQGDYYMVHDNMTILKNKQDMYLGSTKKFFNPNEPIRTQHKGLYFENGRYLFSKKTVDLRWAKPGSADQFFNYERFFTIEAWVKFEQDPTKVLPKGKVGYIYKLVSGSTYTSPIVLSLQVTTQHYRVVLNGFSITHPYNFSANNNWTFLSATFKKSEDYQTTDVDMQIDQAKVVSDHVLNTVYVSGGQHSVVGQDFVGQIQLVRIHNNFDTVNFDMRRSYNTTCQPNGNKSCSICPTHQIKGLNVSQCLNDCPLKTWGFDCHGMNTSNPGGDCFWACRTCNGPNREHCLHCDRDKKTVLQGYTALLSLTDNQYVPVDSLFAPNPGNARCVCAIGQYERDPPIMVDSCKECNYACLACVDNTTTCQVCSDVGYRIFDKQCVQTCPHGYWANPATKVCEYEQKPVSPVIKDHAECQTNEFYDEQTLRCVQCTLPNCMSCSSLTECTSCANSYFIHAGVCQRCSYQPAAPPTLNVKQGATGRCQDHCGNGLHLVPNDEACDDGDTNDTNGCNNACQPNPGYAFNRLSPYEKDHEFKIKTNLKALRMTTRNNGYLEFQDKIYIEVGQYVQQRDFIAEIQYRDGTTHSVNWEALDKVPSKVKTFTTLIPIIIHSKAVDIKGNGMHEIIRVRYRNTGKIKDTYDQNITDNTQVLSRLFKDNDDIESYQQKAMISTLGTSLNLFLGASLSLQVMNIGMFKASIMNVYPVFFALQTQYMMMLSDVKFPISLRRYMQYYSWVMFDPIYIPNHIEDMLYEFDNGYIDQNLDLPTSLQNQTNNTRRQLLDKDPDSGTAASILHKQKEAFFNYAHYSVVCNTYRRLLMWAAYIILFPVSLLLSCCFRRCSPNIIKKWPRKFFFTSTLQLLFMFQIPFISASLVDIMNNTMKEFYSEASLYMAIGILGVYGLVVMVLYIISWCYRNNGRHEVVVRNFNCMFLPFKNKPGSYYYWPHFMLRNTCLLCSLLFIPIPLVQCGANLTIVIAFLTFLVLQRPFKSWQSNITAICSEIFVLVQYNLALGMLLTNGTPHVYHFSRLVIALTTLFGFIYFIYSAGGAVNNLYKFAKLFAILGEAGQALSVFQQEADERKEVRDTDIKEDQDDGKKQKRKSSKQRKRSRGSSKRKRRDRHTAQTNDTIDQLLDSKLNTTDHGLAPDDSDDDMEVVDHNPIAQRHHPSQEWAQPPVYKADVPSDWEEIHDDVVPKHKTKQSSSDNTSSQETVSHKNAIQIDTILPTNIRDSAFEQTPTGSTYVDYRRQNIHSQGQSYLREVPGVPVKLPPIQRNQQFKHTLDNPEFARAPLNKKQRSKSQRGKKSKRNKGSRSKSKSKRKRDTGDEIPTFGGEEHQDFIIAEDAFDMTGAQNKVLQRKQ